VASLVAIYAIADGYKVEKIVTFGQPRLTTQEGVARLGSLPLMRVVDENDIIPTLPPGSSVSGVGPTINGRNGEGDRYSTDGEIHIAVLSPGTAPVNGAPRQMPSPPIVEMKNGAWKTVSGWLGN
jgi:hypothetical protein